MKNRGNKFVTVIGMLSILASGIVAPFVSAESSYSIKEESSGEMLRPGLAQDNAPEPDKVPYVALKPKRESSNLSQITAWAVVAAGFGLVGLILWRNRQLDKAERRWKRRQSKWRLF